MKTNISGHSVINGLLSSKPENIFETIQILSHIDVNGIPSNILDYLRVSPLCIELLQAWSKYVIESISVKKSKKPIQNGESIERKIVVGVLNCISEIFEYYIQILRMKTRINMNELDEFKDNIEKLGILIISKYKINIYRHLNSTSKILISSSLRLLASISSLSKIHKQEILHEFNFTLPSFLSISKFFEYKKRERSEFEQISILQNNNQDIFTLLFEKRSEIGVRIQYLRFVFSFFDISFIESSKFHDSKVIEKDIVQFLKIRNISNSIFKNSIHYDTFNISKALLFIFENTILENEEISNALKASFFNLTVINYIFNNLVDILSQVNLKNQLEDRNDDLERYARIIEKLLRLHINTKTKEKIRLIFVWFKSINRQVKYPIIQKLLINIYYDLTLQEKMDYFESSTVQINYIGESKLEGILISGFISNLIKIITPIEKDDLQKFIIQNILSNNSISELEFDVKYLVNWIIPPFIRKILLGGIGSVTVSGSGSGSLAEAGSGSGIKLLNTGDNLFVNISNLVILINLSKRLSFIIDLIISKSPESQLIDRIEYIINTIKQIIYHSFPEISHILNLLRYYFKQLNPEKDQPSVIHHFFLKRDHYNTSSRSNFSNEYFIGNKEDNNEQEQDEEDDIFINIITSKSPNRKEKKSKVIHQKVDDVNMESSIIDHKLLEKENLNSNMIIFHYIKVQINNHHIIMENNPENCLVICKFEILEIILQTLKSVLKAFGNEFLLSMGYKFDNTKLILDPVYRESYLNDEFLTNLSILQYKRFFDHYIYQIILYSLNIKGLKYDWNCNKLLLFKFLDNLISIIIQYYQQTINQNQQTIINNSTSFIIKYFISMWISIVSKLNHSRQNSVFYYLNSLNKEDHYFNLNSIY
ncbi:Galactose-binding domain-containing protein, partial [Cryptosporidium tyzzeri]